MVYTLLSKCYVVHLYKIDSNSSTGYGKFIDFFNF